MPESTMNVKVSVVMPCLNEQATIGSCIKKAQQTMQKLDIKGEIVVADNGSTDASVEVAQSLGARVVHQPIRGYGSAYQAGIESAHGRYIVIGDSDDTYDFTDLERFIMPLRNGYDFVIGSRFRGKILPGAMSWSHRHIGNPILSGILRWFFHTSISDSHCGMRAFTRKAYDKMQLQTTGMEFASEMVVKAVQNNLKICEVPITYFPRLGESKLNPFRDAWRHLRFMLLFSPTHLFVLPGMMLFILGIFALLMMLPSPVQIGPHAYDVHVMTLAGFVTLLGYQIMNMGIYARMTDESSLPFVSVIIPIYNATSTLKKCLDSLMRLDYPKNRLEILCVDGRSIDESRDIVKTYPVSLLDNPQRGVVSGRNLGCQAAQGELIAFSDADCTFDASWLRNATQYFEDAAVAGVTGPIELPWDQNTLGKCINLLFRLATVFAGGGHENQVSVVQPANHLPTCNAIFRAPLLRKVMPIPEHFVTGEDVAMSYQLQLLGYKLLSVPDVRVQHYKRSTLSGFARQMHWYAMARRQLLREWPKLEHPLHGLVPWILFGGILLIGTGLWLNMTITLLMGVIGWLLVGFTGVASTGRLAALFWQPLVVLIFIGSWTFGFLQESLYPKR